MASRLSVVSSAVFALAAFTASVSGQITQSREEICDESLQNMTMGIGTTFGRCMLASSEEYSHQRFTGCINGTDLCLQKNEFYAQCVPESRVDDGSKPRFANATEIFCVDYALAPAPGNQLCKTEYDMCTETEVETGENSCCDGLSCYHANATEDLQYCLECPGWYALTYERCAGGDLEEPVECCDSEDECVIREGDTANLYGSCRPVDESCCERATFLLGNRGWRCPRNRDFDYVPGPCDTDSQEYKDLYDMIKQDPYTRV